MKGTMNNVKLLHIKCCFFQFFNSPVAMKNKRNFASPQEKIEMTPLLLILGSGLSAEVRLSQSNEFGLSSTWHAAALTFIHNYNKKQDCLSRVVMVTHEKPQILNCNIQFYFKWIVQTITFKLWDKTQFKCNGLFYWFEIELNITI